MPAWNDSLRIFGKPLLSLGCGVRPIASSPYRPPVRAGVVSLTRLACWSPFAVRTGPVAARKRRLTLSALRLVAFLLGRHLFSHRVGVISALLVGVYPYYVAHDKALQDTALFTFLTAIAILFLLRGQRSGRDRDLAVAGVLVGLGALTKEPLLLFVPFAAVWVFATAACMRWRKTVVFILAVVLTLATWVLRNVGIHRRPVFTLSAGIALWHGNNQYVLASYP